MTDYSLGVACQLIMVRVGRLELPASCSQSKRATNCATPGYGIFNCGQCQFLVNGRRGKNIIISCVLKSLWPFEYCTPALGLLLPNAAQYQLRYTRYSILPHHNTTAVKKQVFPVCGLPMANPDFLLLPPSRLPFQAGALPTAKRPVFHLL